MNFNNNPEILQSMAQKWNLQSVINFTERIATQTHRTYRYRMKKILLLSLFIVSQSTIAFTVIAHRGLPRLFPEHSLSGLQNVLKYNIDYVEPDLVLSKEGVPVVLHDIHLDTTTNVSKVFPKKVRKDGRFYAIDFTLEDLKKLTINHRISLRTGRAAIASRVPLKNPTDKILTLEEFTQVVLAHNKLNKHQVGIYPEIKDPNFHKKMGLDSTKIIHDALLEIYGENPNFKIIIQCFYSETLKRLKKDRTPFTLVQLIGENSWHRTSDNYREMQTSEGLTKIRKYADGIAPWLNHLYNPRTKGPTKLIGDAKNLGFFIHPYTLRNDSLPRFIKSEKQILDFLRKIKVDGVFTDNAHTTIEQINSF